MAEPTANDARPIAEISHGPSAFENFLENNQKLLIALGILIAVGTGGWIVYQGMEEGKRLEAASALSAAGDAAALEQVMDAHADTPAAGSAAVLLSDRQWQNNEREAAIATLRDEIAARPDHPATIPAKARLGARLASQGQNDEAAATFEQLVAQPEASYLAPYALAWLGQIARQQGRLEEAEAYLERATADYPQNGLTATAGQTERFLRFEMPTEIDPPEPPPVEEDPGSDATDPDMTGAAPTGNPLLDSLNADPVDADETTPVEPAPEPEPAPGDAPDAGAAEESPSTEGSTEAPPAERPAPESGE